MADYQMYPKIMRHPKYQPAIPYKQPRFRPGEQGWGQPIEPGQTGKPAKFPDVSVNNEDQEMQYAALGYLPSGTPDPEAYRRAMTNNEERPANTSMEYPKILYRKRAAPLKGDDLEYEIANDRAEETAMIGKGWHLKPSDARGEDKEETTAPAAAAAKPAKAAAVAAAEEAKPRKQKKAKKAKKRKHNMSPEARQAASDRMKQMLADKKARKEQQATA